MTPTKSAPWLGGSWRLLLQALIFGLIFGFLLQKGGVAKFDNLIGVLLLERFLVVQVMVSAIIVGMIGVLLLHRFGVLQLQIKETVYGENIVGGLIFGIGFGLLAYCPGTNAAAVGQGNGDALVGIVGMVCGSYLFAYSTKSQWDSVWQWGQMGKIRLNELVGVSPAVFVAGAVPLLIGILIWLEYSFSA